MQDFCFIFNDGIHNQILIQISDEIDKNRIVLHVFHFSKGFIKLVSMEIVTEQHFIYRVINKIKS